MHFEWDLAALFPGFVSVGLFCERYLKRKLKHWQYPGRTDEMRKRISGKISLENVQNGLNFWESAFLQISKCGGSLSIKDWPWYKPMTGFYWSSQSAQFSGHCVSKIHTLRSINDPLLWSPVTCRFHQASLPSYAGHLYTIAESAVCSKYLSFGHLLMLGTLEALKHDLQENH